MATVNISLPDKMAKELDRVSQKRGYASRSELIRDLLREELEKKPDPIVIFQKVPLDELEEQFRATGKYNEKFIRGLIKGLKESSIYSD